MPRQDMIKFLPLELILHIFSYLNSKQLLTFSLLIDKYLNQHLNLSVQKYIFGEPIENLTPFAKEHMNLFFYSSPRQIKEVGKFNTLSLKEKIEKMMLSLGFVLEQDKWFTSSAISSNENFDGLLDTMNTIHNPKKYHNFGNYFGTNSYYSLDHFVYSHWPVISMLKLWEEKNHFSFFFLGISLKIFDAADLVRFISDQKSLLKGQEIPGFLSTKLLTKKGIIALQQGKITYKIANNLKNYLESQVIKKKEKSINEIQNTSLLDLIEMYLPRIETYCKTYYNDPNLYKTQAYLNYENQYYYNDESSEDFFPQYSSVTNM